MSADKPTSAGAITQQEVKLTLLDISVEIKGFDDSINQALSLLQTLLDARIKLTSDDYDFNDESEEGEGIKPENKLKLSSNVEMHR